MGAAQGKVVEIGDHKLTVQSQLKSTSKHANFYLAKDANGQLFVLKRYVIRKSSKDFFARSQWESSLYQKLPNHKHLLRCFGLKRFTDKDGNSQLLSIMEFCSKGSLKNVMLKLGRSLQVLDAMHVLQNVCSALLFLHTLEPPIVHFGVRVDNIFRQTNGNWVLGDFNSSAISPVICSGPEELRKFEQLMDVPKHYRCPEFINIRNSHCVDKAADIWALGVVFYYILFSKYPFDSDRSAILSGKYEIPQSPAYEKPVIDLLESMLQVDPVCRPAIKDLYKNVDELFQHYQLMLGKNTSAVSRQSLLPSDAGLAHFWGHNLRQKQDPAGNQSAPSTPRSSSCSKVTADVTHWTAKALALKLVPPKSKYVRRLVILAWERQNASFGETLPGFFDYLLKQPVFINGVAAYKSLQLIHRLMQDAPPSFTSEMMQHRSFLLTIAERWQHTDIDPWLSQTLIAYALLLEQRLLFLRESFIFECNFSMTNYMVEARQDHYAGFRADFWFSRCFDVVQKMLDLGLQLISCGFLAMGISGIGPTKNHLLFRESILVPVLDDLYGIFLVCTFLLGIIMDCCSLHRTDVSDTKRLYDTYFSRFQALMHRASKSSLVSTPQMLPELPRSLPELSMNCSIYPPPSNVPGLTSHNVEYCEELRSQFVLLLEANAVQKGTHRGRGQQDSRSATAPSVHKLNQSNEFNLQDIFEGLIGGTDLNNNNSSTMINPALPTTSSSTPASPVSTMKRSHSWADQGSPARFRPRTPSNAEWNVLDFDWSCSDTVEWTPSPNSIANTNINVNVAGSPSTINAKTSPFDKKGVVESGDSTAVSSFRTVSTKNPALEITVTKDEDLNNPFAVIERSFKAQLSPRTGISTPSSALGAIDFRSTSITDSGFSTDASHESLDSVLGEGEIPAEEVKICDRIGIGGFAEVYKGEWRGTDVAVKKLLMQKQSSTSLMEFRKEVALLRNLRHPNVVMFMGACTIPPNLMMVTELLQMSLFDLLHNTNVKLTWKMRIKMALDTATGINFLHHSRIIHRDLKSANLLLDKHYGVKVSDFGLSRVKTQQATMTGQCGTFQWMAPEVVSNEKYTEKADVYSFGVILWELAARKIPFEGMNGVQVSVAVVTQSLRPSISEDTPAEIKNLIENCWATDPNTRPPFDEIVQRLKALQLAAFANA